MKKFLTTLFLLLLLQIGVAQGVILGEEPPLIGFVNESSDKSVNTLPPAHSLKRFCPIVGQQKYNDCIGWAVGYAAMAIVQAQQQGISDKPMLINKLALDPMAIYKKSLRSQNTLDCKEKGDVSTALNVLKQVGAPTFNRNSYSCNSISSNSNITKLQDWQAEELNSVNKEDNINRIKWAIAKGNPVVFTIDMSVLDKDKKGGGHAVCLIGYNDEHKKGKIGFEIMNSWGQEWGNQGFGWLGYDIFEKYAHKIYIIKSHKDNDNKGLAERVINSEKTIKINIPLSNSSLQLTTTEEKANIFVINEKCPSDTRFNLKIEVPYNMYATVLGIDTMAQEQQNTTLEPLVFPSESQSFELDNKVGTEYFAVLFSDKPLDEATKTGLSTLKGSKLFAYLKQNFGATPYSLMNKSMIAVKIKGDLTQPFWVVVKLKHI